MERTDGDASLALKARGLVGNVGELASAEVKYTSDEIGLLAKLNSVAGARYAQLGDEVTNLQDVMSTIEEKHAKILIHANEIDAVDKGLGDLERVVDALDHYTKQLEAIAKSL